MSCHIDLSQVVSGARRFWHLVRTFRGWFALSRWVGEDQIHNLLSRKPGCPKHPPPTLLEITSYTLPLLFFFFFSHHHTQEDSLSWPCVSPSLVFWLQVKESLLWTESQEMGERAHKDNKVYSRRKCYFWLWLKKKEGAQSAGKTSLAAAAWEAAEVRAVETSTEDTVTQKWIKLLWIVEKFVHQHRS